MHDMRYVIALAALISLSAFISLYFFYGPGNVPVLDSFYYAQDAYIMLHNPLSSYIGMGTQLGFKVLLVGGIALFYMLLGPTRLSFSLYGVVLLMLNMMVIYMLAARMRSRLAGLIAAGAFGLIPIIVIEASNTGDA